MNYCGRRPARRSCAFEIETAEDYEMSSAGIAVTHAFPDAAQEEKDSVKTKESKLEKPSCWQLIFLQSKVNGAPYNGETLPGESWDWPKDTYFQRRLHLIKILQSAEGFKVN
jgi:hypothetical protein